MRLAGLVLLHRSRRSAGTRRACDVDRARPANPLHVPAGLFLQMAAAAREPYPGRCLSRHLRIGVHLFPLRVRTDRDLFAGIVHADRLHRRVAGFPAGDGAVPARASHPVLDQRVHGRLHAVGFSQSDRFLLASRHLLPSRHHLEHGGVLDRHLWHLWPARPYADRRVPAPGRRSERFQRAALDGQGRTSGRPVQADDPANRRGGVERDRTDQRQRLGQCRRGRHHHDSFDDALWRSGHLCRRGRDRGIDGWPDRPADDGGRRLPDGGVPGRALLGRRAARLCARLRVLHLDRRCGLSAVRAPAAGRSHRQAARAALRQGHDRHLLLLRGLSRLSDGLHRQGELLAALYTAAFMLAC